MATARSTNSPPAVYMTIVLNAASGPRLVHVRYPMSPQAAIEVTSKKTKKLNRSPVRAIPSIPAQRSVPRVRARVFPSSSAR